MVMNKGTNLDNIVSNNEGGLLARLWKNVLLDNNLSGAIPHLVTRYVTKTMKMDVKNAKRKTKSSLLENINSKEMTWKTFTNLIFNFINVRKMDINIKLTLSNGDETYHNLSIDNEKNKKEKADAKR